MKVYIVTSGNYDEYSIEKVFMLESSAKAFYEEMLSRYPGGPEPHLEEYEIEDWMMYKDNRKV